MLKAYKYRIYPNKQQGKQIQKTFGCCRFVYNQMLAYRKEKYETEKKSMSKIDCNNFVNQVLKKGIDLKSKNLLKLLTNFSLRDIIYSTNEGRTK